MGALLDQSLAMLPLAPPLFCAVADDEDVDGVGEDDEDEDEDDDTDSENHAKQSLEHKSALLSTSSTSSVSSSSTHSMSLSTLPSPPGANGAIPLAGALCPLSLRHLRGYVQHNLGLLLESRGDFERALQLLILSLQTLDSIEATHIDLITACGNVGRLAKLHPYLIQVRSP
jgi:hypothetical protein